MGLRKRLIEILIVALLGVFLLVTTGTTENVPNAQYNSSDDTKKTDKESDKIDHLNLINNAAYTSVDDLNIKKGTKLAIISESKNSVYWSSVKEGAKEAVNDINKKLGYTGKDKITLTYSSPKKGDIEDQVNLFDVIMGDNPSAIAIAMIDADAFKTQFDIATENNVAIIACGTGSLDNNIQSFIGVNNSQLGKEAAAKMADALGEDGGKVISLYYSSKTQYDKERQSGFETSLISVNGVENVRSAHKTEINEEISAVDSFTCNDDVKKEAAAKAKALKTGEEVEDVDVTKKTVADFIVQSLIETPDLKGIYCGDVEATEDALQAIEEIGSDKTDELDCIEDDLLRQEVVKQAGNLKVIGFVGSTETIEALKNGKITHAVIENPYGIGYATIVAEMRAIAGAGNDSSVDCGYKWITKKDLNTDIVKNLLFN